MQKHKNDGQTLEWVLGTTVTTLAALAATAVFNHFRAKRAEDASPPMGRFITVDGVRLHHVDRGQGRPVVLLHGNGAMIQDIEASGILTRAAEHYRVIAFDRPGFGYSERPRSTVWTPSAQAALLHNALKQLGIQEPVIVGHSWGALVAVAMALDFPADVAALALLSGYYFPTLRADTVLGSPPAIPVVGDVLRHTVSPLLGRLAAPALKRKLFGPSLVSRSFADFPMEIALRPSQIRAAAAETALMAPAAASLSPRYDELKLPVVILAGDGDKIADFRRQSETLHERLPQSRLIRVPGAGHMIHHIAPDRVLEAIDLAAEDSRSVGSVNRAGQAFPHQFVQA